MAKLEKNKMFVYLNVVVKSFVFSHTMKGKERVRERGNKLE